MIIYTTCTQTHPGRWHADPAHIKSQTEYIAKLTSDGGFELVEVVKLEDSALPSAANVYAALERLKATNFTEFDGLVVLIAGHSSLEGGLLAGPTPEAPHSASGPVPLSAIKAVFQLAPQGMKSTLAARTLAGKPKVLLFDLCRNIRSASPTEVFHNFGAPPVLPTTFDHLQGPRARFTGDEYTEVIAEGEIITRHSDFFLGFSTVHGNQAGVSNDSNFFAPLLQCWDLKFSFPDVFATANRMMQSQTAQSGRLGTNVYPQCAEHISTLRKPLFLTDLGPEDGEVAPASPRHRTDGATGRYNKRKRPVVANA